MQKTTYPLMGLMALLLLAGGAFFSQLNTSSAVATSGGGTLPRPAGPTSSTMGIPALRPSSKAGVITLADVQQFVKSHSFVGGPMVAGSGIYPTNVSVVMTTSREAMAFMHGESTGLPDSAMVYYVTLHGPFRLLNAPVPPGAKIPICQTGFEVFDVQTGNLLLWGAC